MKRREFLLVSAGAGTAVAASGQAAGQEQSSVAMSPDGTVQSSSLYQEDNDDEEDDETNDENDVAEPEEVVVELGDFYYQVADTGQNLYDEPLEIEPGTRVHFIWITDNHDITIDAQPDESEWEGVVPTEDTGFEHEWTFDVEGTYEFHCSPHIGLNMIGTIIVEEGITEVPDEPLPPGQQPIDPDEIGVPLQKHFIGIATFFAIFVTLVFTFYVLKYGETPHSGYPGDK